MTVDRVDAPAVGSADVLAPALQDCLTLPIEAAFVAAFGLARSYRDLLRIALARLHERGAALEQLEAQNARLRGDLREHRQTRVSA